MRRVLEPEVMDTCEDAMSYNAMKHSEINERFVDDLLKITPLGTDILDIGTGTALIPVALCKKKPNVRIMAADASPWMLEIARYNIEVQQCTSQVQLHVADAKKLIFQTSYFDVVISNSLVHHLPEHVELFKEFARVLRPNGVLFVRDLIRPETEAEVESLVALHGGEKAEDQQLLRQSLIAALTVDEVRELVLGIGVPAECVRQTSDRHWTLAARLGESKNAFTSVL